MAPPRRLLLLALIALAALSAFFLVEQPRRRAAERALTEASRLFAFDPGAVDGVIVERPDTTLRFALAGTHWVMQEPLADDAEASAVTPIVASLAGAELLRDLGRDGDPARYGLAPPAATVTLTAGADTLARLELGAYNVDRSAVYARRGGGPVLLVPTALQRAAGLPVDLYRNRRVVVFDLAVVSAFEIDSRPAGRSRWRRGGDGAWFTVVDGDTVPGDSIAVPSVLRRLRGMRVQGFSAGAGASSSRLVTLTIEKEDGSSVQVEFRAAAEGGWLASVSGNPRTARVDDDPSDIARQSVATLRDRRVLQFDPARATRITVVTADTSAVIVRAGDAWAHPNPALGAIDREAAADFVRALRALRFARTLAGDLPPGPPPFSLVVYGRGDTILDEIHGAPSGPTWTVRSRSLGGACEIEAAALDAVLERLHRLGR
jgi:hypothetical protein